MWIPCSITQVVSLLSLTDENGAPKAFTSDPSLPVDLLSNPLVPWKGNILAVTPVTP